MSVYSKTPDLQKLERVGRMLAKRLHEARKRCGMLLCPVCQHTFDGTHLIKCPSCRTLISLSFRKVLPGNGSEKMELDFFAHPLNVGETYAEAGECSVAPEQYGGEVVLTTT